MYFGSQSESKVFTFALKAGCARATLHPNAPRKGFSVLFSKFLLLTLVISLFKFFFPKQQVFCESTISCFWIMLVRLVLQLWYCFRSSRALAHCCWLLKRDILFTA